MDELSGAPVFNRQSKSAYEGGQEEIKMEEGRLEAMLAGKPTP